MRKSVSMEHIERYNKDLVCIKDYNQFIYSRQEKIEKASPELQQEIFKEVVTEAFFKNVKLKDGKMIIDRAKNKNLDFGKLYESMDKEEKHQVLDLYSLCHLLGEWMDYKQIYSFDVDTLQMLSENKQEINNEVLENLKLPYNTFFIENEITLLQGDVVESMLIRKSESDEGVEYAFYLFFKENKEEFKHQFLSYKTYLGDYEAQMKARNDVETSKFFQVVFNLLMYLAQPKLEVFKKRSDIKERKSSKSFYSVAYEQNEVGYTLGSAIRRYKTIYEKGESLSNPNHKGGIKKPHTRCGHFHHYWTGKGRTELIVKYVEPTFVLGGSSKATIHKVKSR